MFNSLKERMDGPFFTIFTPFNSDNEVDYETVDNYLTTLYKQGARKFYAMAYNSRYSQMSHKEISEFNRHCTTKLKNLDKNNIVVVGDPIHCSTEESLDFTLQAKDAGADMISLIVREKYFCDEQILEHFSYIGAKSNFPLLVHEMPFLSGFDGTQMHWPESLIMSLPSIPHVVALKEDAKDFNVACQAFSLEPKIRIILAGGGKARFREFYSKGARCWLNGISIVDASIAIDFWEAMQKGDQITQDFIIEKLEKPFFGGVVKKYGWHRTNKALLHAAGLMHRRERMPLKELSDEEFRDVEQVYGELEKVLADYKGGRS